MEIDVLYGGGKHSVRALPAPALGLPDLQPIGGPVAGAPEATAVDKSFQEFDGMPVLAHPILKILTAPRLIP